MKGKGTWIALLVLVLLGGYAWIFERGEVREPGAAPKVSEMVGLKPEEVTRVELRQGAAAIELTKSGKEWRVQNPVQARADDAVVQKLVDDLLNGTIDQSVAEKVSDYKQYGLDKPALQVTFANGKGKQEVLQTGAKDVRGFSYYARLADKPELFLLSSFQVEDLQKKKADDLRDKTVLALEPSAITRLALQSSTQTVRAEKQSGKWQITAPRPAPADPETMQQMLDQIRNLKVDKFVPGSGDLSQYGLSPPQLTVTVNGVAGEKALLLGRTTTDGKDVYAVRQGEKEVFQLPKTLLTDLSKTPMDLRDKTLLSFKRDDATRITLTSPGQALELTHSGKEWRVARPGPGGKAKEEKLSSLLFSLEMVKASRVVEEKPADLAKYGLDRPQFRVQVTLLKGNQELLIGKQAGKNDYYARSVAQEAVFTIPDFTVTDLKVRPADLLETLPVAKPAAAKSGPG